MRAFFALVAGVFLLVNPAAAEILVGVAAPMTGRFAAEGKAIETSVVAAVSRANAAGGLLGDAIRVVAIDDACDAKRGAEAARVLIEQTVAVVIGHSCGNAALAAAPVYARANTLLFSLTRHPDLTDKRAGPTIFRVAGRDDRQGEEIALRILQSHEMPARVVLVHDRTTLGRELTAAVAKSLKSAEVVPLAQQTIVAGEKDYSSVVAKIRALNPEVVVFGGFPQEAGILFRQLRSASVAARLIGGQALSSPEFVAAAGPAAEGVLVPGRLDACCGTAPPAVAALTRWLSAVRAKGSARHDMVIAELRTAARNSDPTLLFDANGDAQTSSFDILMWRAGKLIPAPQTR